MGEQKRKEKEKRKENVRVSAHIRQDRGGYMNAIDKGMHASVACVRPNSLPQGSFVRSSEERERKEAKGRKEEVREGERGKVVLCCVVLVRCEMQCHGG